MKRWYLRTAAALLAAVFLYPASVAAISAQKAVLLDATTGQVLLEKDAHSRSLVASTTKIMTALVVCEQCNVLDRVRIPKEAVGVEGSSMYLREGEVLSLQELLYGLMLSSGNDAAVALAIYCGGTVEGFAELMNDKARQLQMTGTHFVNPHGLDAPEHFSTAYDLAILAAYAMKNPVFAQTVSTKTVTVGERLLRNHNKLLWQVEGADGVKTGYTRAAGRILVSSATREGRRLVAVTINDGDDWKDHRVMLNNGFDAYTLHQIVRKGQVLGKVYVLGGTDTSVNIVADKDFGYSLTEKERPCIRLSPPGFAYAPVVQGGEAGYAYVCIGETTVGKIPVVYEKTVEQAIPQRRSIWKRWFGGD